MLRWLSNASVRADRIHVTFGDTNMRLTETPDPPACGWWVRLQVEVAVKVSYAPTTWRNPWNKTLSYNRFDYSVCSDGYSYTDRVKYHSSFNIST